MISFQYFTTHMLKFHTNKNTLTQKEMFCNLLWALHLFLAFWKVGKLEVWKCGFWALELGKGQGIQSGFFHDSHSLSWSLVDQRLFFLFLIECSQLLPLNPALNKEHSCTYRYSLPFCSSLWRRERERGLGSEWQNIQLGMWTSYSIKMM